jgi:hypothetical protein
MRMRPAKRLSCLGNDRFCGLFPCEVRSVHRYLGGRGIVGSSLRQNFRDGRARVASTEERSLRIPRDTVVNDFLAGGQQDNQADLFE